MSLKAAVQLSLIATLIAGTAYGATPAKKSHAATTAPTAAAIMTPELQNADLRVKQADKQLDLAKKQLKAAQSILKAAEADLKAARAERSAIALRTQAQGLAQDAGMKPEGNKALAEVDSAEVTARGAMPAPVKDFSAAPANADPISGAPAADPVSPQLDLR